MKPIDTHALLKDMQSCCSPKHFGRSAAKMCIKHAKDLIRALRCKSVSEECAYFNYPYFEKIPTVGCVYSRIICHRERARDVAADTIECLEAENAALGEQLAEKSKEAERLITRCNHLMAKVDKLEGNIARVTAERDAAIRDLENEDSCRVCKYAVDEQSCLCEDCVENAENVNCEKCPWFGDPCSECSSINNKWQWRGLKEGTRNE